MINTDKLPDMKTVTVADIALTFPQSLEILHRHNLDYCCNGRMSFAEACENAKVDPEKVWFEILQAKSNTSDSHIRFASWQPDLLIDFIEQHHHAYIRETIPYIKDLLDKVCSVHGNDQPELLDVRSHFHILADDLLEHLPKEEEILFPAIKRLMKQAALSVEGSPVWDNLQAPIMIMEHEHDRAGEIIKLIRSLTKNYSPPEYACPTFCLTYKLLAEFESDLMQHIHLENNILFQKVGDKL